MNINWHDRFDTHMNLHAIDTLCARTQQLWMRTTALPLYSIMSIGTCTYTCHRLRTRFWMLHLCPIWTGKFTCSLYCSKAHSLGDKPFFWLHCALWKVDLSNLARYAFNQRLEDTKDVTLSCLLVYAINQKGRNPVMPHCENGIWKSTLILSVLSF